MGVSVFQGLCAPQPLLRVCFFSEWNHGGVGGGYTLQAVPLEKVFVQNRTEHLHLN